MSADKTQTSDYKTLTPTNKNGGKNLIRSILAQGSGKLTLANSRKRRKLTKPESLQKIP